MNLKGLLYLEGSLRRSFITFLVNVALVKYSEFRLARNYKFLMDNGLSIAPLRTWMTGTKELAPHPPTASPPSTGGTETTGTRMTGTSVTS